MERSKIFLIFLNQSLAKVIKNKDELIYKLANKYNLPISKVEEIVTFQFKFVKQIMQKGDFEAVRLTLLW